MSGSFGRLERDLIGGSLSIFGKLVLDSECNLTVANATTNHITVQDTLFTGNIFERDAIEGITFTGDIHMSAGYTIYSGTIVTTTAKIVVLTEIDTDVGVTVDANLHITDNHTLKVANIDRAVSGNGVVLSNFTPRQKFGFGRVGLTLDHTIDNGFGSQVEFTEKTIESVNTTSTKLIHPSGNTLTTFVAPSINDVGFTYGNAVVKVSVGLDVYFTNGGAGDVITLQVLKDKSTIVSQYNYSVRTTVAGTDHTCAWSDMILVEPQSQLDVYATGTDNSSLLDASITGVSIGSFATFEIESFEP